MSDSEKLVNILASHNIRVTPELQKQLELFLVEITQTTFYEGKAAGMQVLNDMNEP